MLATKSPSRFERPTAARNGRVGAEFRAISPDRPTGTVTGARQHVRVEPIEVPRGEWQHNALGEWYLIDSRLNSVVAMHVDVEAQARKVGVIVPCESKVN